MNKVGNSWLKSRREMLKINQDELAARLQIAGFDVSRASVSHWENGRHTPPLHDSKFRRALADALRLDVRSMLNLAGYEVNNVDHTEAGERAAFIVDQLPPEKQDLAINILEQFLEG